MLLAYPSMPFSNGRTSLSFYQDSDFAGAFLRITNNSPRAVTVADAGVIRRVGRHSSINGKDGLRNCLEPRDSVIHQLGDVLPMRCVVSERRLAGVVDSTSARLLTIVSARLLDSDHGDGG